MTGGLEALNPDFREVLMALTDAHAEFVVVGAYALAVHGIPRATGDIDILVRPTRENAALVWQGLVAFGAPLGAAGVAQADFARPGMVYQIGLPPRRIDVLTEISGVAFEEAWNTRVTRTLEGRTIAFLGREALVRNKRASGRPKDLTDADRLEQ
jgi:hypothetical protein